MVGLTTSNFLNEINATHFFSNPRPSRHGETAREERQSPNPESPMPLHPAVERLIRRVEELSGKPVHVMEDSSLKVMAVVTPARGVAPAHFVRYRPGVTNLDYVIVYQLGFVERQLAVPSETRWPIALVPCNGSKACRCPKSRKSPSRSPCSARAGWM
jgi:hypothetical protein